MNEIHSIRFTPFYVHERGNSEHDTRQNHSPRRFVRRGSLTHIYIYMMYHPMFTRRVYFPAGVYSTENILHPLRQLRETHIVLASGAL